MEKGKQATARIGRFFLIGAAMGSALGAFLAGRVRRLPKTPRMTVLPAPQRPRARESAPKDREAKTG